MTSFQSHRVVPPFRERSTSSPEDLSIDILESMGEAFVAVDDHWKVTCWNAQAERIHNIRREDILGKDFWRTFPNAIGGPFDRELHRAMGERISIQFEAPYILLRCWFKITIYPVQSGGLTFFFRDVTEKRTSVILLEGQKKALEMNVRGGGLSEVSEILVTTIESLATHHVKASMSLLDARSRQLRHFVAPSLPKSYLESIEGLRIGPAEGSCGTAAYLGVPVVASDIEHDPLWENYRSSAEEHGLRSCWSNPILSSSGRVLGTFAIYSTEVGEPTPREREAVALLSQTAALIIERHEEAEDRRKKEMALQEARAEAELEKGRLRDLLMQAPSAIGITSGPDHRWTYVNTARITMAGRAGVDDFIGKTVRESYPELAGAIHFEHLDKVYRTGVPWEGREVKVVLNRGEGGLPEEAYVNFVYQAIRNLAGEVEGLLIHTIEVTEQVLGRRALQQAHDELELRIEKRTAELERAQYGLRTLSARLLQTQDDERRHLARELHDSVGQLLVAISINDTQVQNEAQKLSASAAKAVQDNAFLIHQMTREIRALSYLLHPPLLDETGLWSALSWFVEGFNQRSNIRTSMELSRDFGRLDSELETAIFRIVQEALTNIHRHSGSQSARIAITRTSSEVTVEVSDEGSGFPVSSQVLAAKMGVGIRGMQERVRQLDGTLEIISSEKGTRLVAKFPILDHRESAIAELHSISPPHSTQLQS